MNSARLNKRAEYFISGSGDVWPEEPTGRLFAEVRRGSQQQAVEAGAIESLGSMRLVVRNGSTARDLVPERTRMRVDGKMYQVQSNVPLDDAGGWREMVCTEVP